MGVEGDGRSSTGRECGFKKEKGPMVKGRWLVLMFIPFKPVKLFEVVLVLDPWWGVGGGEEPSLLHSFLVMGGLEWESSDASPTVPSPSLSSLALLRLSSISSNNLFLTLCLPFFHSSSEEVPIAKNRRLCHIQDCRNGCECALNTNCLHPLRQYDEACGPRYGSCSYY